MSEIKEFRCPNCGAPLEAQGEASTVQCSFCGTQAVVPEELRAKPAQPRVDLPTAMLGMAEAMREAKQTGSYERIQGERMAAAPISTRKRSNPLGCLLTVGVLVTLAVIFQLTSKTTGLSALLNGTPTPTVAPIERKLETGLPRDLRYAGLNLHVTGGVIDNLDREGSRVPGKAFARLDVDIDNTTREDIYLDPQLFQLRLTDGKSYAMDLGASDTSYVAPPAGASGSAHLIFDVPVGAEWQGAMLVAGGKDTEAAALPLTGSVPPDPYPQQLSLPAAAKAVSQGMDYEVLSASLDLDSGAQRAPKDHRFLILSMRMTNTDNKYGANLSSDYYRLVAGSTSLAPVTAPIEVVDYQTAMERTVVFSIPADASSFTLRVGDVRAQDAALGSIPIDLRQVPQ